MCSPDSATIDYCVQNQSLDILSQGIAHSFIGLASITPAANMGMNQVLERPVKGGIDRIGRRWKQRHASADKQHLSRSEVLRLQRSTAALPFYPLADFAVNKGQPAQFWRAESRRLKNLSIPCVSRSGLSLCPASMYVFLWCS